MLHFYVVFIDDARLELACFVVEFLLLEADFFAIVVLLALPVPAAFAALVRVVLVLVFFAAVEVRPLADGVCDASAESFVGATFLRVPRRVGTPSS